MKKFKLAAVLSGIAAASMLVSFAGAGTAMAATSPSHGDEGSEVADVAVGKLLTVAPGTTITDTTFDTVFTLNGRVLNQGNDGVTETPEETLDPAGPANGSQVVHVPVTVPAQTAGTAPCDPADDGTGYVLGCDWSTASDDPAMPNGMPGTQLGGEAYIFAPQNMVGYDENAPQLSFNGVAPAQDTLPTDKFGWTTTGTYKYTVNETSDVVTAAALDENCPDILSYLYDSETYVMYINVARDEDGNLYVESAASKLGTPATDGSDEVPGIPGHTDTAYVEGTKLDDGYEVQTTYPGTDPIPGTLGQPGTDGVPLTDLAFSNVAVATTDPGCGISADDGNIDIAKTTTGKLADPEKYFAFTPTLSFPSPLTAPTTVYAVILDDALTTTPPVVSDPIADTNVPAGTVMATASTTVNGTALPTGAFTFTTGMSVNLKDGQHLHFLNTPFGTVFATGEDPTASYIANGDEGIGKSTVAGVTDPVAYATGTQAGVLWALIGDTNVKNWVDAAITAGTDVATLGFTKEYMQIQVQSDDPTKQMNQILVNNYYPETSLTGIITNNLPYLLIVVLALGGAIAYVAVKSRRRVHTVAAAK